METMEPCATPELWGLGFAFEGLGLEVWSLDTVRGGGGGQRAVAGGGAPSEVVGGGGWCS